MIKLSDDDNCHELEPTINSDNIDMNIDNMELKHSTESDLNSNHGSLHRPGALRKMYLMEQPHNSDYMNMGNDKFIMNIEMKPLNRDEHMNDNHGTILDIASAHTFDIFP